MPDSSLEVDQAANGPLIASLGILSKFNGSTNDGTITRFGWKAQNKNLLMFASEAYNVEIGVTNELFPNERDDNPSCRFNPLPGMRPTSQTATLVAFRPQIIPLIL